MITSNFVIKVFFTLVSVLMIVAGIYFCSNKQIGLGMFAIFNAILLLFFVWVKREGK